MFALVKCVYVLCAALAVSGASLGDMDVVFHLYTRFNPDFSQPLLPTINSVMGSTFSPGRRTIISIHGHADSAAGNFNAHLLRAHLAAEDVNFLAVDWSPGSIMYSQGLANSVTCAERIALFVNMLASNFGYGPSAYRFVGVGLGGHIAGMAAQRVNGVVPHIVAIDPALVGWTHNSEILKRTDAAIVEVIHTNAGIHGYDYPLGTIDFYPNGGTFQTNCFFDAKCAHEMGFVYYAESITSQGGSRFVGTACANYEEATTQSCSGPRNVVFGGLADKTGQSGIYTFRTNSNPPFAQG